MNAVTLDMTGFIKKISTFNVLVNLYPCSEPFRIKLSFYLLIGKVFFFPCEATYSFILLCLLLLFLLFKVCKELFNNVGKKEDIDAEASSGNTLHKGYKG